MFAKPDFAEGEPVLLQRSRSIGNADVYRVVHEGRDAVLKSYRARPWFVRLLLGRGCIRREWEMLRLVRGKGLANVPEALARPDADSLVTVFLEHDGALENPKKHPAQPQPPQEFFRNLQEQYLRLHAAGVAHGDVRRANILVGKDGRPWLVDWATAIYRNRPWSPLSKLLFPLFLRGDLYSLGKIISAVDPAYLLPEVRRAYENPPPLLRFGQWLRKHIYKGIFRSRDSGGSRR